MSELRARLYLGVLLPLLKHAGAAPSWRQPHAVQFEVRDSTIGAWFSRRQARFARLPPLAPIAAWIEFGGGAIRTGDGVHPSPALRLSFRDAAAMNDFFAGRPSLPRVSGALRHPLVALHLFRALSRLRVLAPGGARSKADRALRVKLTVQLVALGLSRLNKSGHEETVAFAAASPERVYAWTVEETGDSSFVRMRAGRTRAGTGVYAGRRPFVRFVFPTVEGAFQVFTTPASQMEAVERGWVRTEGSPEYTRKVSGLLQRLDALLLG